MEAVLSRGQGKAATAVGVRPPLFVDWMESGCQVERVVSTRVSLICAGWLPQDGTFESEWLAVSNTERNHLCCRSIAHSSVADHSKTLADLSADSSRAWWRVIRPGRPATSTSRPVPERSRCWPPLRVSCGHQRSAIGRAGAGWPVDRGRARAH